jgi:hypothetical protein
MMEYLRRGHTREDSARLAKLPGIVLRNAVALAKEGRDEYVELFEQIRLAEAEAVDIYMERLDRSAEAGDFKAVKFGLEALRPERFRAQEQKQANQTQSHIVTDDIAKQQLIELAIKLISEDPKAKQALQAALAGKDIPQLPEGEIEPIDE